MKGGLTKTSLREQKSLSGTNWMNTNMFVAVMAFSTETASFEMNSYEITGSI